MKIELSKSSLEKLERWNFLLEDENISDTINFIINAFDDEIEEGIINVLNEEEHEVYINSDEYKIALEELAKCKK